jgi:hypothetical protein
LRRECLTSSSLGGPRPMPPCTATSFAAVPTHRHGADHAQHHSITQHQAGCIDRSLESPEAVATTGASRGPIANSRSSTPSKRRVLRSHRSAGVAGADGACLTGGTAIPRRTGCDRQRGHKCGTRFTVPCEYGLHHVKEEEGEIFPQLERTRLGRALGERAARPSVCGRPECLVRAWEQAYERLCHWKSFAATAVRKP